MGYLNVDLHDVPSGMGYDPIPAGDYQAQIIESKLENSQSGNLMLNLTWVVLEGDHAGAYVFDRAMLSGTDKAINFGRRKLKTMAEAMGHPNPNRIDDSEELHGRPCLITVSVRKGDGDYSDQNEVKNYKPLGAPTPTNQTAPAPATQPAPPAKTPPPPNQKRAETPFDPPPAVNGGAQ